MNSHATVHDMNQKRFEYIIWASFDGGHHYVPCSKPFPTGHEAMEWAEQLNAADWDWNVQRFEVEQ